MKTATALFVVLLSAQAAADCSNIDLEPVISERLEAAETDRPEAPKDAASDDERRKAYLDCLKPAPFAPESIDIEMDIIADDFGMERERLLEREKTVAAK